jgi:hypothetical protein
LVNLINRGGKWRLTLTDSSGRVYGHYQEDYGRFQGVETGNSVIYNGDFDDDARPLLIAETDEAAIVFLYGMFLGMFGDRPLEAIQDDLARRADSRL